MRLIASIWAVVAVAAIGCSSAPAVSPGASGAVGVPLATIDSPASGVNIAVGQALQVNARGDDTTGVTRLDLRVGDVLVDSATTPGGTAQQTFSALLEWTPSAEGAVTISVLAYRGNGTGSLPASIQVLVGSGTAVGSPASGPTLGASPGLTAQPTLGPGPTSAPNTPSPTRAPRPTVPPPPTPRPTIRADLEVFMQDEDVPATWMAGVPVQFEVYIRNNDPEKAAPPKSTIEVFAAGGTVTRGIRKKAIGPEGVEHYTVTVTPKRDGERALRITILLPSGYADRTPDNNVFRRTIDVLPAATPPASAAPSTDATATP